MAKYMMILTIVSSIFLIEGFLIAPSDSAAILYVVFPMHQDGPLSIPPVPITDENIKRVHRRSVELQPESKDIQQEQFEPSDDLETAAGTNVLRPLFVYRQQIAYRNSRRLAEKRRAIPDMY